MNKLLTQRKPLIATAVALCLLVMVAGWFLLVSPQRAKVAELRGQVDSQESTNDSLRSQVAALQAIAAKLPAEQANLRAMKAKVPSDPSLPALVRLLSSAADKAGVKLTGISPTTPTAVTGAPGLSGIDVTLKVTGDYVALEQYQLALENLSRAFLVNGVSIAEGGGAAPAAGAAGTSSASASSDLSATITGRILVGQLSDANSSAGGTSAGATNSATS